MDHLFLEITLVLALATALGVVARALKQPTLLGYIATGIIVGPLGLMRLNNVHVIDTMAQFGIAFLLFLVGMEMNFAELKHVGRPAIRIAGGQILFTSLSGLGIALLLGLGWLPALYVGITLTFSSTIIVVKLLSEKKALDSLYGKIVIGVLLVQDFIALGVLILLSGMSGAGIDPASLPLTLLATFAKGAALLTGALLIGKFVMPRLMHRLAGSQETLFLASLTWGLGVAALASLPQIGLSLEIGAFMAGVALAESVEHYQIMSRVKSLRDFFAVMFFIVLGSKMVLGGGAGVWLPTVLLSAFVLIGNPVIVMALMAWLGYRPRTAFMAGVTVAQISEFSLIVVMLGHRIGHIDERVVSIVTAVGLTTIVLSSYLILYSDWLYERIAPFLESVWPPAHAEKRVGRPPLKNHIVLIGCHRMGHNILHSLVELKREFLVVDFNPDVVTRLHRRGLNAVYGDITDPDIQELAGISDARAVISTVPTVHDSVNLIARLKEAGSRAKVIVTAESEFDAMTLYEKKADYVVLPHFIGGLQLANILEEDATLSSLDRLRAQDLAIITEHP
jgi:Kef-type K+ transport system membrane component KefB/voltage-gated potassium channel Kch